MKILPLFLPILFSLSISAIGQGTFSGKEISFPAPDSLEISADIYRVDNTNAPYIILFHQANFSRGAYRTIAPRLNELGYNCLAVDQRSGHKARDVINKTSKRAIKANKGIKFKDAVQDAEAAFLFVRDRLKAKEIIIWGSSYSASIVIYLGSKYPENVKGILSFSPGEYFQIEGKDIASFADKITCPVFISSAKNEQKKWKGIYERISSKKNYFLPSSGGAHGSKALWPEKKGNREYWSAVLSYFRAIEHH